MSSIIEDTSPLEFVPIETQKVNDNAEPTEISTTSYHFADTAEKALAPDGSIHIRKIWTFDASSLPEGVKNTPLELTALNLSKENKSDFSLSSWKIYRFIFQDNLLWFLESLDEISPDHKALKEYVSNIFVDYNRIYWDECAPELPEELKDFKEKRWIQPSSVNTERISFLWNSLIKNTNFVSFLSNKLMKLFSEDENLANSVFILFSKQKKSEHIDTNTWKQNINNLIKSAKIYISDLSEQTFDATNRKQNKRKDYKDENIVNYELAKQQLEWKRYYIEFDWYRFSFPLIKLIEIAYWAFDNEEISQKIRESWLRSNWRWARKKAKKLSKNVNIYRGAIKELSFWLSPQNDKDLLTMFMSDDFISSVDVEKLENPTNNEGETTWEYFNELLSWFLDWIWNHIKDKYLVTDWTHFYPGFTNRRIFNWDRMPKVWIDDLEIFSPILSKDIEYFYTLFNLEDWKINSLEDILPNLEKWKHEKIDFLKLLEKSKNIYSWVDWKNLVIVFEFEDDKKICIWVNVPDPTSWKSFFETNPFIKLKESPIWKEHMNPDDYNNLVYSSINKKASSDNTTSFDFQFLPSTAVKDNGRFSLSADLNWIDTISYELLKIDLNDDRQNKILRLLLDKSTKDFRAYEEMLTTSSKFISDFEGSINTIKKDPHKRLLNFVN